jgi:hypothetical protein
MSREVFQASLDFINNQKPSMVLVSGGEPTEHPLFIEFINRLNQETQSIITVASNGSFLEDKELTEAILKTGLMIQITHDKLFYPHKPVPYTGKSFEDEIALHNSFVLVEQITKLIPMGRAESFAIESHYGPKCFNFLQVCASDPFGYESGFQNALRMQESLGKFCNPTILANGNIVFGESSLCRHYGNVVPEKGQTTDNIASAVSIVARMTLVELMVENKTPCSTCFTCNAFENTHPATGKSYKQLLREHLLSSRK